MRTAARAARLAALMALVGGLGLLPTAPAHAAATVTSSRLAGTNRYETAAAIAEAKFPNGVGAAIVASGLSYPDALAGAYLAGQGPAAILLTDPASPPPALLAALARLRVRNVAILGGESAVSEAVQDQLAQTPSTSPGAGNLNVKRLQGANRFETMEAIDTDLGPSTVGKVNGKPTAILASGLNFPDALAAAPAAYADHLPIVLTLPDHLSQEAGDTLNALGVAQVLVMGGSSALGDDVINTLPNLSITVLQRFAGTDRTDTAGQFAAYEVAHLGFSNAEITLARGDDFADALAGAQYAGDPKPTLLVRTPSEVGPFTSQYLDTNRAQINHITGFGGASAISDVTLGDGVNAAEGNPTCAGGPCDGGGGGGTAGSGGLAITPSTFVNDYNDHPLKITGTGLGNAGDAWVSDPSAGPSGCIREPIFVTRIVGDSELDGTLAVGNSCPPGPYDLFVRLDDPGGSQTRRCNACVTVKPAIAVQAISPAQVGNDGTDGYTHVLTLDGTNVGTAQDVVAAYTGTTDALCEDASAQSGVVHLSALTPNGANELAATIAVPEGCPPGAYTISATTDNGSLVGVCASCLTVTAYTHAPVVLSMTPSSGRKGDTIPFVVKGFGLQRGELAFGNEGSDGKVHIAEFNGGYSYTATQISGELTPSPYEPGSAQCTSDGLDCAAPGTYTVFIIERGPTGSILPAQPGSKACSECFTLLDHS